MSAFFVAFLLCFTVARHIYNVLVWPYEWASGSDHVRLIATHFLEQIMTHVKLAMFGAGFISFPVVAMQIYKFVAPGLYKNERQAFLPYLIATPVLFCIGAAVVYFIAMPVLIKFSIGLDTGGRRGRADHRADAQGLGVSLAHHDVDLRLRAGVPAAGDPDAAGARWCRDGRWAGQCAALRDRRHLCRCSPADAARRAVSMIIMALPTVLLYEGSIYAVRFVEKRYKKPAED